MGSGPEFDRQDVRYWQDSDPLKGGILKAGIAWQRIQNLPECHEGPDAFERFDAYHGRTLNGAEGSQCYDASEAYRKKVDANPNRRGPKRKSELGRRRTRRSLERLRRIGVRSVPCR